MSYDFQLFHKDARAKIKTEDDFEEIEYPILDKQAVADFIESLKRYDYKQESESPYREFIKDVEGCPIQVTIFETEISFAIPYWKNSESAIFDALMDASEIMNSDFFAMYDPQSGEWT